MTVVLACCGMALFAATFTGLNAQQPPAFATDKSLVPGANGQSGADLGLAFFAIADTNVDGMLSRAELRTALETFLATADIAKAGSVTAEQLQAGVKFRQPRVPQDLHLQLMMSALPDQSAAKPLRQRRVLVFNNCAGFIHTPIPLAARMIEAFGNKTKAWTTTITWDPAQINAENLKLYDAVVLNSTTSAFLDDPNDAAATAARKSALINFVRGGKGLVGIHGAGDSYHANSAAAGGARAGGGGRGGGPAATVSQQIVAQGDKNGDQKVDKAEIDAVADAWFAAMDTRKVNTLNQSEFLERISGVVNPNPAPRAGGAGRAAAAAPAGEAMAGMAGMAMGGEGGRGANPGRDTQMGTWPDFNKMIGGFFKYHFPDQLITLKVDDPASPLTSMFKGQPFQFSGEIYTFAMDTWSRENMHVLTSIDYTKMSDADKAKENFPRSDHDYGLTWIRKDGNGRVFYFAFGNEERVFFVKQLNEQLLAGLQYALGDLQADDSPSVKAAGK